MLDILKELLSRGGITSAHYVGYAHGPILRLLLAHLRQGVSTMDYWGRYGVEGSFSWEEENGPCPIPEPPDWLKPITFYIEGCPVAELLIRDVAWSSPGCFDELIMRRSRPPPKYALLVDEARAEAGHRDHTWTETDQCSLGILKHEWVVPRRGGWSVSIHQHQQRRLRKLVNAECRRICSTDFPLPDLVKL